MEDCGIYEMMLENEQQQQKKIEIMITEFQPSPFSQKNFEFWICIYVAFSPLIIAEHLLNYSSNSRILFPLQHIPVIATMILGLVSEDSSQYNIFLILILSLVLLMLASLFGAILDQTIKLFQIAFIITFIGTGIVMIIFTISLLKEFVLRDGIELWKLIIVLSSLSLSVPGSLALMISVLIIGMIIETIIRLISCKCSPPMMIGFSRVEPAIEKRFATPYSFNQLEDPHCVCIYCLKEFVPGDLILSLACNPGHLCHFDCISQWGRISSECPRCAEPIELK